MSCEYEYQETPCSECGRRTVFEIGASAVGHPFYLKKHEDRGLVTLTDWVALWAQGKGVIVDEYGKEYSPDKMIQVIAGGKGWEI